MRALACIFAVLISALLLSAAFYFSTVSFLDDDSGVENSLYSSQWLKGKTVLVLVPHEDDDLLIAGQVLPGLISAGCDVKIVFTTNGDKSTEPWIRIQEAKDAQERLGVSSENLIFLGYPDANTLYTDSGDRVGFSIISGATKTDGMPDQPDYHYKRFGRHADYTHDNFLSDIKNVVLDYMPDIILAIDFDFHMDHRGTSMAFEKVLGEILAEKTDYHPMVLKSFAYSSAWYAKPDFYSLNPKSVHPPLKQNLNDPDYETDVPQYLWSNRVRLPVYEGAVSRSIVKCDEYAALAAHLSQYAFTKAEQIINADMVYWLRRTDSLTYDAQIETSSGRAEYLNDFQLVGTYMAHKKKTAVSGCVAAMSKEDTQRCVTVKFDSPKTISRVSLYDDFSLENNITGGRLIFSDGSVVEVPGLNKNGSETAVSFPAKSGITFFKFIADSFEGSPGLCEIEAFERAYRPDLDFIKIKNAQDDNFLYNCFITQREQTLLLDAYSFSGREDYILTVAGEGVEIRGDALSFADDFESCTVRAQLKGDPSVYDQIKITRISPRGEKIYAAFIKLDRLIFELDDLRLKGRRIVQYGYTDEYILSLGRKLVKQLGLMPNIDEGERDADKVPADADAAAK